MLNIFTQPFEGLKPIKKTLLLIYMTLMTLVAVAYNAIPLIFYRPEFQCSTQNGVRICPEKDACMQQHLKYDYKYSFTSLPQQYNLYCEDKVIETNILTLMMLSHFTGSVFNIIISKIGSSLRKVMFLFAMASGTIGASLLSLLFIKGTTVICLALMIWSFCKQVILCYLYVVPGLAFKQIKQKTLGATICCWPILSMFMGLPFWLFEDWKYALAITLGIPHLIISYLIITKLDKFLEGVNQPNPIVLQLLRQSAKHQSTPSLFQVFKSPHFRNFAIFLTLYSCGYVSLFSSTLYLNTVSWNLYLNIFVVNLIQFFANIAGIYVSNNMDIKKFLRFIFSSITTIYLLYVILPQSLQFGVIILSKGLTDFIWLMLCIDMLRIFPTNYVSLVAPCKNSFSLAVSITLPYVRYAMQSIGSSMFPVSGLYYLIGTISISFMNNPLKQEVQNNSKQVQMNQVH